MSQNTSFDSKPQNLSRGKEHIIDGAHESFENGRKKIKDERMRENR